MTYVAKNQNRLLGEVVTSLLLRHLKNNLGLVRDGQGTLGHNSWQVDGPREPVQLQHWHPSSLCGDGYGCAGHCAYEGCHV